MQVSSTTSSTGTSSTTSSNAAATAMAATVDYNSFLTLLVQEMKNQDPTNPTDPTQYMSQLASFSSVEQQVESNTKLDSMLTNSALTMAESAIGRTATSSDGTQSGQVVAVALSSAGVPTALLANGSTMTLDSSVTISAATTSAS